MQERQQTVPKSIFERAIFLDTSALYALVDPRDGNYHEAADCLRLLAQLHLPVWVTNFTIVETYRRVLQSFGPGKALPFLGYVCDGGVNVERALQVDEEQARVYLGKFNDQDISYTDAISFAVMKRLGIGKAFAFDWHFRLIGFTTVPPLYFYR